MTVTIMKKHWFYQDMNRYAKYLIISAGLTVVSILAASSLTGVYQTIATVGIAVFWIAGLLSFFVGGYKWYKKDLLRRSEKEFKQSDSESDDRETDENSEKTEIERLFS